MTFRWVVGPSRRNDFAYTRMAILDAVKVARSSPDLLAIVARIGWCLDCCLGLDGDVGEWPEHVEVERSWNSLWQAVIHPADRTTARRLRAQAVKRLLRLDARLERADDEDLLMENVKVIVDGADVSGGS